MQNQASTSQEDLTNDPNLLLAITIVKSIQKLRDGQVSSSEGAEESADEIANLAEASQSEQMIEVKPVMDLVDKLEFKKTLTQSEVAMLTSCSATFVDPSDLKEQSLKMNEFLKLLYFSILNSYQLSLNQNFLGFSAFVKLCQEAISLLKRLLEILQKKETVPELYSLWVPQILKIIVILNSKQGFDLNYQKYMRQSSIKIDLNVLAPLNQYFSEYTSGTQQLQKKNIFKSEDIAPSLSQISINESDDIEKILEYTPSDYSTIQNLLSNIEVKNESDDQSQDEEMKGEDQQVDFNAQMQQSLANNKIMELYQKAIDKFLKNLIQNQYLISVSSKLLPKILKSSDSLKIKLKNLTNLFSKTFSDKTKQSLGELVKHNQALSSQMDIDTGESVPQKESQAQIDLNFQILYKLIDLQGAVLKLTIAEKDKKAIMKNLEEFIQAFDKDLQDIFTAYIKGAENQKCILGIFNSIVSYLFQTFKDQQRQMQAEKVSQYTLMILQFLRIINRKHTKSQSGELVKQEDEEQKSKNKLILSNTIKTRSQLKKESVSKSSKVTPTASLRKSKSDKSESQAKKLIEEEKEKAKEDKDIKVPDVFNQIQVQKHSISVEESYRSCISCLIMIIPLYLETGVGDSPVNVSIMDSLIDLAQSHPSYSKRLIQGLLSQFTKTNYAPDIQPQIMNLFLKVFESKEQSKVIIEFFVKMIILIKNQDSYKAIGEVILTQLLSSVSAEIIQSNTTLLSQISIHKFIVFVAVLLNSNEQNKRHFIEFLFQQITSQDASVNKLTIGNFLLEIILLKNEEKFPWFKKILFGFILQDQDVTHIKAEIEKFMQVYQVSNQNNYDDQLLLEYQSQLSIEFQLKLLKGKLGSANRTIDQKISIFYMLKFMIQVNEMLEVVKNNFDIQSQPATLQDIAKSFMERDVDGSGDEQQDEKVQYLMSKLESKAKSFIDDLSSKLKQGNEISSQQVTQMEQLMKFITYLSSQIETICQKVLVKLIKPEVFENFMDSKFIISFLIKVLNLDSLNGNAFNKIFSLIEGNQNEKLVIQQLLDPNQFLKLISNLQTKSKEDQLFNFCLHFTQSNNFQNLFNHLLLFKNLYYQLATFFGTDLVQQIPANLQIQMGAQIMKLKMQWKILEAPDLLALIDGDYINKLLKAIKLDTINSRELGLIKILDKVLSILYDAESFLQVIDHKKQGEFYKQFILIINDVLHGFNQPRIFKNSQEMAVIQAYLTTSPSQQLQQIVQTDISKQCSSLWNLAFSNQFSIIISKDEISKKGGVQLVISFNDMKGKKSKSQKEVKGQEEKTGLATIEEEGQKKSQDTDKNDKSGEVEENQVSLKIVEFIIDILKLKETDTQKTEKASIVNAFIKALVNQEQNFQRFIFQSMKQQNSFKILLNLVKALRDNCEDGRYLSKWMLEQLSVILKGIKEDEEIISIMKLAQIASSSNLDLNEFIVTNILPLKFKNYAYKLIVFEFLLQLGCNDFNEVKEEGLVYNKVHIQQKRAKYQEEYKKLKDQYINSQQDSAKDDKPESQKESVAEGFQKAQYVNENYLKYMEKPETICTFTKTKKEFVHQHWYYCYTCGLTGNNGCCSVCAFQCHKGHQVIYSKKSNFFCDCAENGKCISLPKNLDEHQNKQDRKESDLLLKMEDDISKEKFGVFGSFQQFMPPRFLNPLSEQRPGIFGESKPAFRQFNDLGPGSIVPPPNEFFSESSEDDLMKEINDGMDDIKQGFSISQHLNNMRGIIKIFKDRKVEDQKEPKIQKNVTPYQSQLTNVNPLEDPMSDVESVENSMSSQSMDDTNMDAKSFTQFIIDRQFQIDFLKSKQGMSFLQELESSFAQKMDSLLKPEDTDMQISDQDGSQKGALSLLQNQILCSLSSDLLSHKKTLNPDSFKCQRVNVGSSIKKVVQQNINLNQQMDCNNEGLTAIAEENEVNLYPSSQFHEDPSIFTMESMATELRQGSILKITESQKLHYSPLLLKFNPNNQRFLAVVGSQNLDILTITEQGKIANRLIVELMLDAFSKDLSIINVYWLPGVQTMIAVGTAQFIRIYDLSQDSISPTHNILIAEGLITDFTFTKATTSASNMNQMSTQIIISASNGKIYYQELNYGIQQGSAGAGGESGADYDNDVKMIGIEDNSQITVVSSMNFDQSLEIPSSPSCQSLFYCQSLNALILSYEECICYAIKIDNQISDKVHQGTKISKFDDKINNILKQQYFKTIGIMTNFKEVKMIRNKNQSQQLILYAQIRKHNTLQSAPILIKFSESTFELNLLKQTNNVQSLGLSVLKHPQQLRIMSLYDDGSLQAYLIPSLQSDSIKGDSKGKIKYQDLKILKTDLPKEVTMPVNFFEKLINVIIDGELKPKLSFTGDLVTYFKNHKALIDVLSKRNENAVLIQEQSKKVIKFQVKLDTNTYVMVGFRIKLETPKVPGQQSIKFFNRVNKLKVKGQYWFEYQFCDIEVLYNQLNNLEIELSTDDCKNAPIRFYSIEIFTQNKKDFDYREKLRKIQKFYAQKQQQNALSKQVVAETDLIQNELKNSNHIPILSWEEKLSVITGNTASVEAQLMEEMDILTYILPIKGIFVEEKLISILDKLKQLMKKYYIQSTPSSRKIVSSIKRCIKQILFNIDTVMSYSDLKNKVFIDIMIEILHKNSFGLTELSFFTKKIEKIYHADKVAYFQILEQNPDLIQKLVSTYLELIDESQEVKGFIAQIISLIISDYTFQCNRFIKTNNKDSFKEQIISIQNEFKPTQIFSQILSFLLHENEEVQKAAVSSLMKLSSQYSENMKTLYQDNKNDRSLIVVDFTIQLLDFLLNDQIAQSNQTVDIYYSVAYKLIKILEISYFQGDQSTFIDIQIIISQIVSKFIAQVAKDGLARNLYEDKNANTVKKIYVNLLMANILLQEGSNDQKLKIKSSVLGVQAEFKLLIINNINSNQQIRESLQNQLEQIIKTYQRGFKLGYCSFQMQDEGFQDESYAKGPQANQNNNLLKASFKQSSWKWHPLFLKVDNIFTFLDRKITAQALIFISFFLSHLSGNKEQMISEILHLSQIKPGNKFLKNLGLNAIKSILKQDEIRISSGGQADLTDEQEQKIIKQQEYLKSQIKFQQFIERVEKVYQKYFSDPTKIDLSMEFYVHKLIKQTWKKSAQNPKNWQLFLSSLPHQQVNQLYSQLFKLQMQNMHEETQTLCLALLALGLEQDQDTCSVKHTQEMLAQGSKVDVFEILSHQFQEKGQKLKLDQTSISINKLLNILILEKNNKSIRSIAAHLLKGLFFLDYGSNKLNIFKLLVIRLQGVLQHGINSLEYFGLLSYVCNYNYQDAMQSSEIFQGLTIDQKEQLSKDIHQLIEQSNKEIISHPNLELYFTLKSVTNFFNQSNDHKKDLPILNLSEPQLKMFSPFDKGPFDKVVNDSSKKKITNPYLLEIDPCIKCFEQKQLPFQVTKLSEIKQEMKYTDSNYIMKFSNTYVIRQIILNIQEVKGLKAIKGLNVYVNNKQGVDLADMRNNWSMWRKVKSIDVAIGQKTIEVHFPLPISATNMILEFQTTSISKQISLKESKANKDDSVNVTSLDSVMQLFSKDILKNFVENENSKLIQESSISDEKEFLNCPRCGKQVSGKNGNCNSCGENALQCTYCRNINYEKLDAFFCNECGLSRYVKFDIQFECKTGFATEQIINEDLKGIALQQIDSHQVLSQTNYTSLMKKRQTLCNIVQKINMLNDNVQIKQIQDIFGDECSILYQGMMKSLNAIKILKLEINKFVKGIVHDNQEQLDLFLQKQSSSRNISEGQLGLQHSCFSCIQENLKGILMFIEATSKSLSQQYSNVGLHEILYEHDLKMHTESINYSTRKAICSITIENQDLLKKLLPKIESDIFNKISQIPSFQLSQNLVQQSFLVTDLLVSSSEDEFKNLSNPVIYESFWRIFNKGVEIGSDNFAISETILSHFLEKIKSFIMTKDDSKNNFQLSMKEALIGQIKEQLNSQNQSNWAIACLLMKSSIGCRQEITQILTNVSKVDPSLNPLLLSLVLKNIDKAIELEPYQNEQYFELLAYILSPQELQTHAIKDNVNSELYLSSFQILFNKIENQLLMLIMQENYKGILGDDGFMPQINSGQNLQKLLIQIQILIKESKEFKSLLSNCVSSIIKCFLKVRKLNLIKNKVIQNCEIELEKMFKELSSDQEEEKQNFILQCIMIIESGECDLQEQRFLFEEICNIINPIVPEPVYYFNLHKAQTQEFFLRGKMNKNPYSSKTLGKTFTEVREKICKELELAEPELLELLSAGKILGMALPIKNAYEQIWWPHICKQKDPDQYDIPSISKANSQNLTAMSITYRLAGIDGEATEDRIENLPDQNEEESNQQNEQKYMVTQCLTIQFDSRQQIGKKTNGVQVLLQALQNIKSIRNEKYLVEWLLNLIGYSLKVKVNRQEFLKLKSAQNVLASKMFESVGMQSQIETNKGLTIFDQILIILESLVNEMTLQQEEQKEQEDHKMEIDQQNENTQSVTHVEIFIQLIEEACTSMLAQNQGLDKTPKKIKAISKILPLLINAADKNAIEIIIKFILESLQYQQLDSQEISTQEKFKFQFYMERVIDILENIHINKSFLKDQLIEIGQAVIEDIKNFLNNISLQNIQAENEVHKYKQCNKYILRLLIGLTKNHPSSQKLLFQNGVLLKLYQLSQQSFKDKVLTILAQDLIDSFTNKNQINDEESMEYLKTQIDQQKEEKKKLALRKREEMLKKMQAKKNQNKFMKTIAQVEELGPKCIVCQEGYTSKPSEILGMYVFCKRLKIAELSSSSKGFITTLGYTTVTHSNYIHFLCHQNAYRADSNMKQPKKEWEGAIIRNEHSKCNNLFPVKGGQLTDETYNNFYEKYFNVLSKQVGNCDSDRTKVLLHDLKSLLKRFAYEESFSRDTHGGGPEHNMHFIPMLVQMLTHQLSTTQLHRMNSNENDGTSYIQEAKIQEFLDQGLKQKKHFMAKLEEEKQFDVIEEDHKFSEDNSQIQDDEPEESNLDNATVISLDQFSYFLTMAMVFCQYPKWQTYKKQFLDIILFQVSCLKEDKAQMKSQQQILSIVTSSGNEDKENLDQAKKSRKMSDNRIEQLNLAIQNLRPLLIMMLMIEEIKKLWDLKKLSIFGEESIVKTELYFNKLMSNYLCKDSLHELMQDCDDLFRNYKDKILKIESVEQFLKELGILEKIIEQSGSVESYIFSHF